MTEGPAAATVIADAIRHLSDAFRPVLYAEEGSAGRRTTGTAFVVEDDERRLVVTAKHVLRGCEQKYFGVVGQNTVKWPRRYSTLEALQPGLPDADLAWASATVAKDDEALAAAIPIALTKADLCEQTGSAYVAVGFPTSKAKLRDAQAVLHAKLMAAVVELAPAAHCSQLGLHPQVQMGLTYSQHDRTDLLGDPTVGAVPTGMSGGAVFALMKALTTDGSEHAVPFLVGVLTEFHEQENTLVATRIKHLWTAIGAWPQPEPPLYRRCLTDRCC